MGKPIGIELPKFDRKPRNEIDIRRDLYKQLYEMAMRFEEWKCQ